jgi:hypothetical protein
MNRLLRIVAIATVAAVPLLGLAAAPAGAKTVPAAQWMTKFCTIYGDWIQTIQQASQELQSLSSTADGTDLTAAKNSLVEKLSQSIDATDTAVSDLEAAGVPDAQNGKKIDTMILTAVQRAKSVFQDAESSAESISITDAATFVTDTKKLNGDLSTGLNDAFSGLSKINKLDKSGTFKKLSNKNKACKALNG